MLESIILVNLAICFIFGTVLLNRKYDLAKLYGAESKSLGIAFLLLMAFTINLMPLVSAADSDDDGVDDADDDCPDTVEQDGWSIANNDLFTIALDINISEELKLGCLYNNFKSSIIRSGLSFLPL